ncbi:MAG: glycosyltransferase family 2 protein [Umezawaea sp.]
MSDRRPRLLVFIVAYYAESTLTSVLQRIPAKVRDDFDCEILVVDDASEDRTYALGREYQQAHPEIRMTVLRNELNQGYGGNQKIGYTFAIERGFDVVVLLHGDGQYAPEEMPRLLEPLQEGRADAVFGSRMMTRVGALRGGRPLYKYVDSVARTIIGLLCPTGLCARRRQEAVISVGDQRLVAAAGTITFTARRASSAGFRRSSRLGWRGIPPKCLVVRRLAVRPASSWC